MRDVRNPSLGTRMSSGETRASRTASPMFPRRRRAAPAFALVEALAAGVLLAMGGVVVAQGMSQAAQVRAMTRDSRRAAEVVDRLLTKIDLIGPVRLAYEGLTEGTVDGQFHWSARYEEEIDPDLYRVTVTVRWNVPGGTRQVEAHTLLNDAPRSRNPLLQWEDL